MKRYQLIRKLKWSVACIATYLLFHKPIEFVLSTYIVTPVLAQIDSIWYNDLIFMGLFILILYCYFTKKITWHPANLLITISTFFSVIYLFYRFTEFSYTIISFSFCPLFKYGDVLVLFSILQWQLALREIVRVEFTPNKESLHNDNSIGEFGEDLLGYNKYAETLAKKILSSNFEKSFAIGINGKWGLGKTSFLDLLKRTVKDKDLIAIDFNPWNSQTPQAIIRDFFNTIEEKIREHHPEIASELVNYANKLAAVNDSTLSKSLQSSVSVIFGYDSLNSLHETINRLLRQWKKKIVVYVDDLDRLDTNEIIEVIRLIRNTADFHNTFFIVCYDKQYISEALKGHNPYNHGLFLEKIFQLEINLPHFKKEILRQVLASKLKKSFDEKYHNEIDRAIFGDSLVMTAVALSWIESMRDVTRLFNSIMLNLSPLLGEVEVKDFIELEILRLKYPMVYEMLFRQKSIILNFNKEESDNRKYVLRRGKDMPSFIKIPDTEKNEKYLRIYLNNNHENLQITKGEIDRIVDSVENIFQDTIGHFYPSGNFQSVVYPDKFDRYFSYNLFDENLSNNDFTSSIALDLDSIKIKIDEWVSKGLEYDLQKRFMEIHEFGSKEEFEKIIRAIFYLANRPSGNTYQTTLGYDGKDLMEKLADYQNKITALYGANGKSKLHSFITSTLTEAQSPFQFESQFVRYVNNKMMDDTMFPLSQEELKSLQILYLKKYADETKKIDLTVFGLFWNTEQTSFVSVGGNSYRKDKQFPQEAIDILKELVSMDLNEFIERVIEVEPLHQKLFSISNTAIVLYGSWANFKTYLDSEDEAQWLYLKEFKEFFVAFEKERFEKYVPFHFKVIPENRKLRNS